MKEDEVWEYSENVERIFLSGEERVFQRCYRRRIIYRQPRYLPTGNDSLLIEFGNEINPDIHRRAFEHICGD